MKRIAAFLLSALIICAILIIPAFAEEVFYSAIALDDVTLNSSQDGSGHVGTVSRDDKVIVIGEKGKVCLVIAKDKNGNEIQGYCDGDDIAILYKGIVTTRLNVRSKPTTSGDIMGVFEEDAEITIIGEPDGNWYSVEGEDGDGNRISGYCHSKYIENVGAVYAEYDGEIKLDTPVGENDSKEGALALGENYVSGSLPEEDSVRWYKFTLEEKGDAVIRFSCTESTIYVNCWKITVYNESGDILSQYGLSARNGQVNICVPGQEKGVYYAEIVSGKYLGGNPLTNGHDNASFSISAVTSAFTRDAVSDGTVMTVSESGTVVCVLNGTLFLKQGDAEATVAYCNINGKSGPVIISQDKESVAYINSTLSKRFESAGSFRYDGETYYYSSLEGFVDGVYTDTATAGLYCCTDAENINGAAEKILDIRFERTSASFDWEKWLWPAVAGVVVLIIIIAIICKLKSSRSYSSYSGSSYSSSSSISSSSPGYSSSSSSSSASSYSGTSWHHSSYNGSSDPDYCKSQIQAPCLEARENLKAMLASNSLTYEQKQELVRYHNNHHLDSVSWDPTSGYSNIYDSDSTFTSDTTSCGCSSGGASCGCGAD